LTSRWRFASIVLLLLGTGVFLHRRCQNEIVPARTPFTSFPNQLGDWKGRDIIIPRDVLDVLGAGDFLLRDYTAPQQAAAVNLFLAYVPTQRTGDTIHSPENCLPGAGWWPVESGTIWISLPRQAPFWANRHVFSKGTARQIVVYWYWAHGRAASSEYVAKFDLIADAIRFKRSDGSLIRLITPLQPTETDNTAQGRILDLAENVAPILERYVPR
jgi:EpsI family protein